MYVCTQMYTYTYIWGCIFSCSSELLKILFSCVLKFFLQIQVQIKVIFADMFHSFTSESKAVLLILPDKSHSRTIFIKPPSHLGFSQVFTSTSERSCSPSKASGPTGSFLDPQPWLPLCLCPALSRVLPTYRLHVAPEGWNLWPVHLIFHPLQLWGSFCF